MSQRIEGFVSKKAITYWLENYEYLAAGDRPPDAPVVSSGGAKSQDGVRDSQLNLVMLDQAIKNLPSLTKAVCKAKWVHRFPRKRTLQVLGISESVYNRHRQAAIQLIYQELNGEIANYKSLMDKISGSS